MNATTIKINLLTKGKLDTFREYKNESYDEVINKMIFIAENVKKGSDLSEQAISAIEAARERIKKGNFLTEAEAKKRLGL
jgi:predicted transcriptional regulator